MTGVDLSAEEIRQARVTYSDLSLFSGSAYDHLTGQYGQLPVVLSLEVVEHVYAPCRYAKAVFNFFGRGGIGVIFTPYHGYRKNVALTLSEQLDAHFTVLWDQRHIKFWSIRTLNELLREAGFLGIKFHGVVCIPFLAKSMIAFTQKS